MYAVIESGGKQYRVEFGTQLQVDRLEAQAGDTITLDRVLLVADGDETAIGQPIVDGAIVKADVVGQDRGQKIVVFKYKPKARTRVKNGFRAELTTLRIADISFGGRSAAKDAEKAESEKAKDAAEADKAATAKATADADLAAQLAAASAPAPADEATAAGPEKKTSAKKATAKKATASEATPTKTTAKEADVAAEDGAVADAADATDADSSSTESSDATKDE
jgi:large subunit ribosomal protein L21